MSEAQTFTREQAQSALRAMVLAQRTLVGYARYIDIPGVPESGDVSDRAYEVVETPLAKHHVLTLNALQLLVQRLLVYRDRGEAGIETPIDFALLRGETPHRGRVDGTPPPNQTHDPSLNFSEEVISPISHSGNESPTKSNPYETDPDSGLPIPRENTPETVDFAYTDAGYQCRVALEGVLKGRIDEVDGLSLVHALEEASPA